jgi:hypothetical protein
MRFKLIIVLLLIAVLTGAGWYTYLSFVSTPIGDLLSNPRKYDGSVVTISGTVRDRLSLPIVKYFTIKDETGEIRVITERMLPSLGSQVRVKGRLRETFTIRDSQFVVLVEELASAK